MAILQQESELNEIVRLVGNRRLIAQTEDDLGDREVSARRLLYQSAFHEVDTYCSQVKQDGILRVILDFAQEVACSSRCGRETRLHIEAAVREKIRKGQARPEKDWPAEFEALMAAVNEIASAEAAS